MKDKIKVISFNLLMAAGSLAVAGGAQFGITALIKDATGWDCPTWFAYFLAGCSVAGLVAAAVASMGVAIPAAVAAIISCSANAAT